MRAVLSIALLTASAAIGGGTGLGLVAFALSLAYTVLTQTDLIERLP